jgi:hypothetical protein
MGYAALSVTEIRQGLELFERCLDQEYPVAREGAGAVVQS